MGKEHGSQSTDTEKRLSQDEINKIGTEIMYSVVYGLSENSKLSNQISKNFLLGRKEDIGDIEFHRIGENVFKLHLRENPRVNGFEIEEFNYDEEAIENVFKVVLEDNKVRILFLDFTKSPMKDFANSKQAINKGLSFLLNVGIIDYKQEQTLRKL